MKHFYTVVQSMETGRIDVNEWDVVKETPKTITYTYPGNKNPVCSSYTKNKDYFNKVHLDGKLDYTGRYQNAYVLAGVCESKEEALKKVAPLLKEWIDSLSKGIDEKLEELEVEEDMEMQ